jgi:hypothetical protein
MPLHSESLPKSPRLSSPLQNYVHILPPYEQIASADREINALSKTVLGRGRDAPLNEKSAK